MKKVLVATAVVAFLLLITHSVLAAESININTASAVELDAIVGIGPALAQRIIDARPFASLDDLLKVKGIAEKTLQKIKDQGLASLDGATTLPKKEPSPVLKELPNAKKSDTKVSVAAVEPITQLIPQEFSSQQNPWTLFLITFGLILVGGASIIFWKNHNS